MTPARTAVLAATLLVAGSAGAAELGRMFFTPVQRATLDNARKQNIRVEIGSDNEQSAAAPVPQNVSVNGVIRRSDGKNTIWLNNRAITEQPTNGINATIGKNDNRVRLRVPESGRNVDLKVGQSVEIGSGTVEESYLRRPGTKPEAKPAPPGEKTGADVSKVITAPPPEAVKSQPVLQRRPARDARDAPGADSGTDAK